MTNEENKKKEFESIKTKVKKDNYNHKKKTIENRAKTIKEKLDKVVEDIKTMESNTKGLANAVGFEFSSATIENGKTIKNITNLKKKIDAFVDRANAIGESDDITESRKLTAYSELLEKIEKRLSDDIKGIVDEHKDLMTKKMEQDLAKVIHDNIANDKKSKNASEIKEREERKIGPIDKLRHKDELIEAEVERFKAQNELIDRQSVDYDSENYLENEYAKVIVYGEIHKTEGTPFATFYRNIKLIESLLDKGVTKKAIEKEREEMTKESDNQKKELGLSTKERIEETRKQTERIKEQIKEKSKEQPKKGLSTMETGRALHKLDNLIDEINRTMSNELQSDISA